MMLNYQVLLQRDAHDAYAVVRIGFPFHDERNAASYLIIFNRGKTLVTKPSKMLYHGHLKRV